MSSIPEFDPLTFSGQARLFPLPNLVMFPHALQMLHIFEPRYREMTAAALAADRLIGMALLEPGWEADYHGRPAIAPIACLGMVVNHERLDDGRYNLLLFGARRVRIVRELNSDALYREAKVELLDDTQLDGREAYRDQLQARLVELLARLAGPESPLGQQVEHLLEQQMSLGALTDVLAFALELDLPVKRELLLETCVDRRAEQLVREIEQGRSGPFRAKSDKFPPDFSLN